MNATAASPQAARERLAEKLGALSQGLANGGGNRLSALLISLFTLLVEALRAIAWPAQAAATPLEPAKALSIPRSGPVARIPAKVQLTAPARPRRPRQRRPGEPAAGKAPARARKNPALSRSPIHNIRPAGKSARAIAQPRRPPAKRTSAPAGVARLYYSTFKMTLLDGMKKTVERAKGIEPS
jgi:hypothetical protein